MKKLVVTLAAMTAIAFSLLHCGGSSTPAVTPPPAQANTVAFLQQKPNSNLLYPVLGRLSGTQFTTTMIKDPTTGNYVSAAIGSIVLSPNLKKATFEVFGGTDNNAPTSQWDIYVGTIDGATLTQVTNDVYVDVVPHFNPAGTKVVFTSERPVGSDTQLLTVVRNVDGTGEQVLPSPAGAQGTWHATFSPDGSKIAVEAWGITDTTVFDGIFLMNADGSNPTLLTNADSIECWCEDENPYFTSDGTHIVFSRLNWSTNLGDIYIMKADGTELTRLTDGTGANFDPLIVRDTATSVDRILFSSNRTNVNAGRDGFDLYKMNLDGTGLQQLTTNNLYDGFNLEHYDDTATASVRMHHQPRTPAPPEHSLRW
jgi:Tol biopolymer transport system component